MRDCLFFVDSYRTVAFGLWTIFNIIKLVNLPLDPMCSARKGKETDLLELNYELLIVFGVFPAVVLTGVTVVGLVFFPYVVYTIWSYN